MKFRLFTGDAIELLRSLPGLSIDCLITDVAYESLEKHRAVGTTTRLKESDGSSNEWFQIFKNERFPEFFTEAHRVLKKNTHFYFYCDDETAEVAKPIAREAGFTFWNTIVWVKTKGAVGGESLERDDLSIGLGYHWRRTHENILMFEKGKRKLNDLSIPDVLPFPRVRGGYPTEKPVELNKLLVSQSTKPEEVVLDPFMGSGSAGNAALRLGRRFVGGDLKEAAVALARQRLLGTGAKEDPDLIPLRGDEPEPETKKTRTKKSASGGDIKESAIEFARQRLLGTGAKEDLVLGEQHAEPASERPIPADFQAAGETGGVAPAEVPYGAAVVEMNARLAASASEPWVDPEELV